MMYSREHFFATKKGMREAMESNLIFDRHMGTKKHKSSFSHSVKSVEILFDAEPEEVLGKMEFISGMIRDGIKVDQYEISEMPYCTKYLKGVRYAYPISTIREKISDRQVESKMRNYIVAKLTKDAGKRIANTDCRVMQLFKDGIINWEACVNAHKGDCNL